MVDRNCGIADLKETIVILDRQLADAGIKPAVMKHSLWREKG
jgi:hypothetical protein